MPEPDVVEFMFWSRFRVIPKHKIDIDEHEWFLSGSAASLDDSADTRISLRPAFGDGPISEATEFAVAGKSYPTEEAARAAGERWTVTLRLAFAARHIGIDFGERSARASYVGDEFRRSASDDFGINLAGDRLGLQVLPVDHRRVFMGGSATATVGTTREAIAAEVQRFAGSARPLSTTEDLALSIFSSSFAITDMDAKFVQLVTVFEALAEQRECSAPVQDLLDELMDRVKDAGLSTGETSSLVSQLRQMKRRSVNQAAKELTDSLGARTYLDVSPMDFFRIVYDMRNRMVHGSTERPPLEDVTRCISPLCDMLTDIFGLRAGVRR